MRSLLTVLLSLVVTAAAMPLCIVLSRKLKILDHPGGRKTHLQPTPLLGGLAVYLGFLTGYLLNTHETGFLTPLFWSATLVFAVSLFNDIRPLSAAARLLAQLLATGILIANGWRISFLPEVWWGDAFEMLVTGVWVTGITNAFNYLDGVDALAAGSAGLNFFVFSVILFSSGQIGLAVFAVSAMAACLGFIPFNVSRRFKIFLGDAGSTFLGFTLAGISLAGNWAQANAVRIVIPILILGVPIFDMTFTTVMRIKEGKVRSLGEWLEYAGRDHFHHYLLSLGLKPLQTVLFIFFVTLSLGISAIMVSNDRPFEAFLSVSQGIIIFSIIGTLITLGQQQIRRQEKESKTIDKCI